MLKFATVAALSAMMFLTGCNTIRGAGQDVSSAGHAVSDAAEATHERIQGR